MSSEAPSRSAPPRRPTIREIAKLAGVSTATVSRVASGRGYVAAHTRRAVEAVIREHGYTPNRHARAISRGRTGLVGLTLPMIHPAYFAVIVAGVAEALYEHDMRIVVCPTQHEHDREASLLERLMRGTTDCGMLILPEESSTELRDLMDHGYRFVVVDPRKPIDERVPTVSAAHSAGADSAVRHLLAQGHRRIAAITGPNGWVATEERKRGYAAALAAAGVLPESELVVESNFDVDGGGRRPRRCLHSSSHRAQSLRSTTSSRSARCRRRVGVACACPRMSRSSASTTRPRRNW